MHVQTGANLAYVTTARMCAIPIIQDRSKSSESIKQIPGLLDLHPLFKQIILFESSDRQLENNSFSGAAKIAGFKKFSKVEVKF